MLENKEIIEKIKYHRKMRNSHGNRIAEYRRILERKRESAKHKDKTIGYSKWVVAPLKKYIADICWFQPSEDFFYNRSAWYMYAKKLFVCVLIDRYNYTYQLAANAMDVKSHASAIHLYSQWRKLISEDEGFSISYENLMNITKF